jgi:hypothetical protein
MPIHVAMAFNEIVIALLDIAERIPPPAEAIITVLQHVNEDLLLPLQHEEAAKVDKEE